MTTIKIQKANHKEIDLETETEPGSIAQNTGALYTDGSHLYWKTNTATVDLTAALSSLTLGATSTLYQGDVVSYDTTTTSKWTNSDNSIIWKDLYGDVNVKGSQNNAPTYQPIDTGTNKFYAFASKSSGTTEFFFTFHLNHDYKLGSDVYFHVHHLTNTNLNANLVVNFYADVTLAQLSYNGGNTNPTNSKFFQESGGGVRLATITHQYDAAPQYRHVVTEVQLSSAGGSSNTIDSNKINVDSIIMVRLIRDVNINDTATNNYVFVLQCDLHYQTVRIGTKLRTFNTQTFSFLQ